MTDYDVAICGAGVAGLTLAAMLGGLGRRVLVVDKQKQPRNVHKGEVLQPSSLRIMSELGFLDPLYARGALEMDRLVSASVDGTELMSLDYRGLPGKFQHCLVHYYKDIIEVFIAQAKNSVDFCPGTSVEDLIYDSSGRVAGLRLRTGDGTRKATAALTVAADGRNSRIRRAVGLPARAHQYGHHLVALDIAETPGVGTDIVTYLSNRGVRVFFQMPGNRARLYVQVPLGGFREVGHAHLAEWITWLTSSIPGLTPHAESIERNFTDLQVMPAWRYNAPNWSRPGLVLIGDAAHCVHPMVGQGMNTAIGDAWTLGTHLKRTGKLTGSAADDAIRSYENDRRPKVEYVGRLSHNLATLFTATSTVARTTWTSLLRRNQENLRLRYQLTYNVAGLGSKPFTLWDWICVSGFLPDPNRDKIPVDMQTVST